MSINTADETLPPEINGVTAKRVVGELVGSGGHHSQLCARLPLDLFPRVLTFLANQRSIGTRREYRRELEDFARYLAKRFPELKCVGEFEPDHIVYYKAYAEASGLASATVSRKLASLSAYFRFLASERETLPDGRRVPLIDRDLFYGLKRPRVQNKKETAALTTDQVERLLHAIPTDTLSSLMHHALLSTLFGTGRRLSAVRGIKRGDIAREAEHLVVRVTTKGGKKEKRVLLPQVWASIERYLLALQNVGVTIGPDDYIFQAPPARARGAKAGEPINPQAIFSIFRKYCGEIGLKSSNVFRFSPHSSRATYATTLSRAGVPIEVLQDDMGHANIETTRKYVKRAYQIEDSPAYKLPYFSDHQTSPIPNYEASVNQAPGETRE